MFIIAIISAAAQLSYAHDPYGGGGTAPVAQPASGAATTPDGCFNMYPGHALGCAYPFERRSTVNEADCTALCLEFLPQCASINYNVQGQTCDLFLVTAPVPGGGGGGGGGDPYGGGGGGGGSPSYPAPAPSYSSSNTWGQQQTSGSQQTSYPQGNSIGYRARLLAAKQRRKIVKRHADYGGTSSSSGYLAGGGGSPPQLAPQGPSTSGGQQIPVYGPLQPSSGGGSYGAVSNGGGSSWPAPQNGGGGSYSSGAAGPSLPTGQGPLPQQSGAGGSYGGSGSQYPAPGGPAPAPSGGSYGGVQNGGGSQWPAPAPAPQQSGGSYGGVQNGGGSQYPAPGPAPAPGGGGSYGGVQNGGGSQWPAPAPAPQQGGYNGGGGGGSPVTGGQQQAPQGSAVQNCPPTVTTLQGATYFVPTGTCAGGATAPGSATTAAGNTDGNAVTTTTAGTATTTTTAASLPDDCPAGEKVLMRQHVAQELLGSDDQPTTANTVEDCTNLCLNNQLADGTAFACKSADHDAGSATCILSSAQAVPVGTGTLAPAPPTFHYIEKMCVPESMYANCAGPVHVQADMLLIGFAERVLSSTTLAECLNACVTAETELGFTCLSGMIFYQDQQDNCILNTESAGTQPELFVDSDGEVVDYFEPRCAPARRNFAVISKQRTVPQDSALLLSTNEQWSPWNACSATKRVQARYRNCGDEQNVGSCRFVDTRPCVVKKSGFVKSEYCDPRTSCCALFKDGQLDCSRGGTTMVGGLRRSCLRPKNCRLFQLRAQARRARGRARQAR